MTETPTTVPGVVVLTEPAFDVAHIEDNPPMDTDLVVAWAEALESGAYKQGQGYLRSKTHNAETGDLEDRYCCLGVLVDIAQARGYPVWWEEHGEDDFHPEAKWREAAPFITEATKTRASTHRIPEPLAKLIGFSTGLGERRRVAGEPTKSSYWHLNKPHTYGTKVEVTEFGSLAGANDEGVPFTEIARGLREALLGQVATESQEQTG